MNSSSSYDGYSSGQRGLDCPEVIDEELRILLSDENRDDPYAGLVGSPLSAVKELESRMSTCGMTTHSLDYIIKSSNSPSSSSSSEESRSSVFNIELERGTGQVRGIWISDTVIDGELCYGSFL